VAVRFVLTCCPPAAAEKGTANHGNDAQPPQEGRPGRSGHRRLRELERILPDDYTPLLDPRDTQQAVAAVKLYIESPSAAASVNRAL
jgi:hypothetical protein